MKKILLFMLSIVLVFSMVGCQNAPDENATQTGEDTSTETPATPENDYDLYIFQFKVEIQEEMELAVAEFEELHGVTIKLENVGGGTPYQDILPAEMQKESKPGLFSLFTKELPRYQDYVVDLSGTAAYQNLNDPALAAPVTVDGAVYGIPYTVEGGGVIYNKELLGKLAGATIAEVDTTSLDTIVVSMRESYESYKNVVEYIQANAAEIGVKGAFSVPGKVRWPHGQHMTGAAISRAFPDEATVSETTELTQEAIDRLIDLQNTYDLYINNATMSGAEINTHDYDIAVSEFAMGESVFIQQGDWAYIAIANVMENASTNLGFLPIPYNNTSLEGDDKVTDHDKLPIGVPAYWAINSQVSAEEQELAAMFLDFLYVEKLNDIVVDKFGFTAPYKGADVVQNPLSSDIMSYINEGKTIAWTHNSFPQGWSDLGMGTEIQRYTAGEATWQEVVDTSTNTWKEYAMQ